MRLILYSALGLDFVLSKGAALVAKWKLPDDSKIPTVLTFKWGGKRILDEGFVAVPKRFLRCMRTALGGKKPLTDLRLILAIVDFARPDSDALPTIGILSSISGLDQEVVGERLKDLKTRGLINYFHKDGGLRIEIGGLTSEVLRLTGDETDEEEPDREAY